ncbi:hypothetical protein HYN48_11070 [Flavobacterium magnum]|uniref:Porin n=1 Tax=Flavobacterium magnum TaxID=2162713 RepID=A0A2S0RH79_9FLAO|nr:porin [Flavobacterium magnum]AWA30588.1 hypothetical protein HYN48_11070 [Flavobacterium magnum]
MKKISFAAICFFWFAGTQAQEVTTTQSPVTFSGYLETYYSYDLGEPEDHTRPGFIYSHNRHNELNVNIGFVKANYLKDNVRGNLALMAGTYAQHNLAAEQDLLKNVFEANVGVRLSQHHNLWVDAGIMPAHIGFESAVGKDCPTLTRSILADNSPYYEAGVKLGYTSKTERWYLAVMYLNGWQRIQKIDGNQTPAFGSQVTYRPNAGTMLNWSTYVGNEQPDSIRKWRYFNNFYGLFRVTEKVNLTAGFDIGMQQTAYGSSDYDVWYSPVLIARYKPTDKIQLAARAEYYQDQKGVIIATGTPDGFRTYGFSANFDYLPASNVMFRIEARTLNSRDEIFLDNNNPTDKNVFLTTALAISF